MLLGLVAGTSLLLILLVRYQFRDILAATAAAGWALGAILLVHIVYFWTDMRAWQALLPREHRRRGALFRIGWIGESVGTMLPVAQVGGDVVRARLASRAGIPASTAAATVVADVTITVFVQVIYTLVGLVLLVLVVGQSRVVVPALVGSAVLLLAVTGFYLVQRRGMFRLIASLGARLSRGSGWRDFVRRGDRFDRELQDLYSNKPRAVVASAAFTFLCWLVTAAEVWIAMKALGAPGGYAAACILESVTRAIRTGTFLVPGAIGLQEGGYVAVGALLGIPPETSLALALIRRARELLVGVPGLIAWQWIEGRRWWRRPGRGTRAAGAGSAVTRSSAGAR